MIYVIYKNFVSTSLNLNSFVDDSYILLLLLGIEEKLLIVNQVYNWLNQPLKPYLFIYSRLILDWNTSSTTNR